MQAKVGVILFNPAATVSGGTVTAVKAGSANIIVTAKDGGKTRIYATANDGSGISGSFEVTIEADKTLSWSSDRPSVATVADGKVTGVAEGTAKITATSAAGGFTATCTVNVTSSMDQGTKVFTMTGDYSFYLNGDLIYTEINNSAFALEG